MADNCHCSILATRVTVAVDVDSGSGTQQLLCLDCGAVLDVRAVDRTDAVTEGGAAPGAFDRAEA